MVSSAETRSAGFEGATAADRQFGAAAGMGRRSVQGLPLPAEQQQLSCQELQMLPAVDLKISSGAVLGCACNNYKSLHLAQFLGTAAVQGHYMILKY